MAVNVKDYSSLGALIKALAEAYHDGHLYPMAARIGVASGTVQQWENGMIKAPKIPTLRLLCNAYGLDLGDLIDLISKAPARRKLARSIRGGSDAPGWLPVVQVLDSLLLIRHWLRRLAQPLLPIYCPA